MTFDNLVHTAPFPASISTPVELNTPNTLRFKKKLGLHRGNPRCFFETQDIQRFGFVPGAKYDMALRASDHLEIAVSDKGKRAVVVRRKPVAYTKINVAGSKATTSAVRRERVLSVIDINSQVLEGFRGDAEVLVTVTHNLITITKLPKE